MILCGADWAKKVDSAVFPGQQGGPLEHVIAAKAVCFKEAAAPEFKAYQHQIVLNSRALAAELIARGFKLVGGGSDNHLILIDLRGNHPELDGYDAQMALEAARITTNRNVIPGDTRSPFKPSGLRLGTPAITSRGLTEAEMPAIADFIDRVLNSPRDTAVIKSVADEVLSLCRQFPLPYKK
jgi:glycine hydroxymethyltransferase